MLFIQNGKLLNITIIKYESRHDNPSLVSQLSLGTGTESILLVIGQQSM